VVAGDCLVSGGMVGMDHLLAQWDLWNQQIEKLEEVIGEHFHKNTTAQILATVPGVSAYSGLALASRIGPIKNFPRPRSLANYWGLTPRCRNSGEATDRHLDLRRHGLQSWSDVQSPSVREHTSAGLPPHDPGVQKRRGPSMSSSIPTVTSVLCSTCWWMRGLTA